MDPTTIIVALLGLIGGVISAGFGFILNGMRGRMNNHGTRLNAIDSRLSRIEGARDAEKE